MYEATGKIKVIFDTQTFPSGFTKREFVLTIGDSQYPQDVKFELIKDKCSWLDNFQEGQEVTVSFDIRGNEFKGRYYVNLNCWKIQAAGAGAGQTPQGGNTSATSSQPFQQAPTQGASFGEPSADDMRGDDIPF